MIWADGKNLYADPKSVHQTELKNLGDVNVDDRQSMYVLTISEKLNKIKLKFPEVSVIIFLKIWNFEKVRVLLMNE